MGKESKEGPAMYEFRTYVRFDKAMTVKEVNRASKKLDKAVIKAATVLSEEFDDAFETNTWAEVIGNGNQG